MFKIMMVVELIVTICYSLGSFFLEDHCKLANISFSFLFVDIFGLFKL